MASRPFPTHRSSPALSPPAQVNFRFVPPPLQVPFINVVVLGWSAFLALLAAEGPKDNEKGRVELLEETGGGQRK